MAGAPVALSIRAAAAGRPWGLLAGSACALMPAAPLVGAPPAMPC